LIFLDNYRKGNSLKIATLEALCNGHYPVPVKNGTAVQVPPYVTVIIGSNFSIDDVYN